MNKKTVWIDLENSPHVQIFENIITELSRDYNILVTARDYNQTVGLLELKGINYKLIGKHAGSGTVKKTAGVILRALRLFLWAFGKNIDLSVCHGSRGLILASKICRIPSIILFDYEYSERFLKTKLGSYLLIPSYLGKKRLIKMGYPAKKLNEYPGLKENIYLPFYKNDPSLIKRLGLDSNKIIILLRPPSEVSHYNTNISYDIFSELFSKISKDKRNQIIFVPRYESQKIKYKKYIDNENVRVPATVEEGLNLIYYSDIVISGGGTMNREAAAMNTPVYSIFQGKKPGIDKNLEKEGRLSFINKIEDFSKIKFEKKNLKSIKNDMSAYNFILDFIRDKA